MNRTRIFFGISLISLAVLMLELGLTRLFSATMYYHFAFMAISLALFGSGASGVFVYLIQRRIDSSRTARWLSISSMMFALTTNFALYVILANPLTVEPGPANYYRLVWIYVATTLPFFFGGAAITLAITRFAKDISRLYLFDLAGAACGCLLLIPVINTIGAISTAFAVSAIAAAAAVLFSTCAGSERVYLLGSVVLLTVLGSLTVYNAITDRIDVRMAKGVEQDRVLFSKWNSFSRITVEWDLDDALLIKIDADAATGITRNAADVDLHQQRRNHIDALAYHLKPDAKALIIGPGGGNDIMTARVFGAREITAVEINPIIARDIMLSEPFKTYSGAIYQLPDVRLVVDEGRSFIRSSNERFDVIQATMVDTWAATAAGAFALSENYLYTVEAFKDYVNHLDEDGLLTMTRWYFQPPDQLLRLVSLSRAMMDELGIQNPDRHIILVVESDEENDRTPATFIFKKSEFTNAEVNRIEAVASANSFRILYTPNTRREDIFTRMIEAPDPSRVWRSFATDVAPTRDNNPFFFNSVRLSNLGLALKGASEWHKTNLGTFVLFALLGITFVLVCAFIIGPLVVARGRSLTDGSSSRFNYLFYFGCLGAGFIIVEIAMIQRFILFLGHPVYALAVVLFSLLTFSALGSHLSGRFSPDRLIGVLTRSIVGLVALILVYILVLPPLFYGLVHLPHFTRVAIAVILIAPLAIVMGMPMPIGIRILARTSPEIVPWAWGINGATSVTGSVAALVIAILTGFDQALLVGASIYFAGLFFIRRSSAAKTPLEKAVKREAPAI